MLKDKIQCTDTANAVWIEGPIPVQSTLEVIEHTLIESKEFQRYNIDLMELLNKEIIFKPRKQTRGDKKSTIHVVILEDKTSQAKKSLKIYISKSTSQ